MRALRPLVLAAVAVIGVSAGQAQTAADVSAAVRAGVTLTPETRIDGAQISPLRATQAPQLGDAMTCLKLAGMDTGYIAVFFERGKVLSYRSAVALDRCAQGPFTALVVAAPAKPNASHKRPAPGNSPAHHADAK